MESKELTPLGMSDLADILEALREHEFLLTKWELLGIQLGIHFNKLKVIEAEHRDMEQCLCEMLATWLRLDYDYKDKGRPSWQGLVNALRYIKQINTAEKIAKEKFV